MMVKRYLIGGLMLLALCCAKQLKAQDIERVSSLSSGNGKVHLLVDSVPFPIIGSQIRLDFLMNCDHKSIEQCKPFFNKAKELGVNCVQVPIWWKLIEPSPGSYSWSVVDSVLSYINDNHLKMELLWYSTNMCGESFSNFVPDYILDLPGIKLVRKDGRPFWNYYGHQYNLILNDTRLLERETQAATALMEHIKAWDAQHARKHPVISVQVHNEPDILARWRYDQLQLHYGDGRLLSKADTWQMTLDALNTVGQAFKNSSYKIVTRTNVVTSAGTAPFPELPGASPTDILNLDGIDFVGTDPYVTSVDVIKSNTLGFLNHGNTLPLTAENKGSYANGASLLLAAVCTGGGYNFYDLATSKFVIDHTTDPGIDHGLYNWDLSEKSHVPQVKCLLKGLTNAAPDVATTSKEDFIAFNLRTDEPAAHCSQTIQSSKIIYTFSTDKGASGFSITRDNYLLVYCTEDATVGLSNATFYNPCSGYYDNTGAFVKIGSIELLNGNILQAEKGLLYKIEFSNASVLTSTASLYIGSSPIHTEQVDILDFEDEDHTATTIASLHTDDWQTNQSYQRNTFALNPEKNRVNQTERCASFTGYHSDAEWWYGYDIVLSDAIALTEGLRYVHVTMMTNNTTVDTNRGLILRSSAGGGTDIKEYWVSVTDQWKDYVFPIPNSATDLWELRFMHNHKAAGEVTYLDEIVINNDPNPRALIPLGIHLLPRTSASTMSNDFISSPKKQATAYSVYNLKGQCVHRGVARDYRVSLPSGLKGFFILKMDGKSKKLLLK